VRAERIAGNAAGGLILPLGSPAFLTPMAMVNVPGDLWPKGEPALSVVMAMARAVVHLFGKQEPRPGRKMGHLNCYSATADAALRKPAGRSPRGGAVVSGAYPAH
jgi:phosphoribosylaminoimidazole carboxylase (NCAIR synthetase)